MPANLIDLALLCGAIALVLYILAIAGVLPWTGGAIHILIVLAAIFIIAWIFLRFFRGRRAANHSVV